MMLAIDCSANADLKNNVCVFLCAYLPLSLEHVWRFTLVWWVDSHPRVVYVNLEWALTCQTVIHVWFV